MSGRAIGQLTELGLCEGPVRVRPRFFHHDIHTDDFGPNAAAEVQANLSEVTIEMTLLHYDKEALDACWAESLGGCGGSPAQQALHAGGYRAGIAAGAGQLLGNGLPMFSSGCHYISLSLSSQQLAYPWRFRTCHLAEPPVDIPLGTEKSAVKLNWRAIPYAPLLVSGATTSYFALPSNSGLFLSGSAVTINGQAYALAEQLSSGKVLFDHTLDT